MGTNEEKELLRKVLLKCDSPEKSALVYVPDAKHLEIREYMLELVAEEVMGIKDHTPEEIKHMQTVLIQRMKERGTIRFTKCHNCDIARKEYYLCASLVRGKFKPSEVPTTYKEYLSL